MHDATDFAVPTRGESDPDLLIGEKRRVPSALNYFLGDGSYRTSILY
jgi:hypothetical protein